MKLIDLSSTDPRERVALLATLLVAGVANMIALILINQVAQAATGGQQWTFVLFVLAVGLHLAATRRAAHRINRLIEQMLLRAKTRLVDKIERAELRAIEDIGPAEIHDRLAENMSVISMSASAVGGVIQAVAIVVFALVYVAFLSGPAFVVIVVLQAGALLLYRSRVRTAQGVLRTYSAARVAFLAHLMGLIRGAKEIKLSRVRSLGAQEDLEHAAAELRETSVRFSRLFDDSLLFMTCNLYLLLAGLVLVLPQYAKIDDDSLPMLLGITLFLWGNMQAGLSGYPSFVQALVAIDALEVLEARLDGAVTEDEPAAAAELWPGATAPLEISGLEYVYPAVTGGKPFRVGPVDLTIGPGEVVFIVGGNGSGKSTLLKTLTGLYPPTRGQVRLGGVIVEPDNVAAYREQISLILAEFHLFSRTYGLDVDPERVRPLLHRMRLTGKTAYRDGRFTRRNLSTGQRKRLAMTLALLEDRPILVLDEWPADQDPEFRRYFYEDLIPAWRAAGKIVLAVSHDDRYFRCADRVLTLEYGAVHSLQSNSLPVDGR